MKFMLRMLKLILVLQFLILPTHACIYFICFAEIKPQNVINMDETPMYFDMASDTTYAPVGSKDVLVKTTGHEKLRFTVVLTVTASGSRLRPMLIFKNLKNIPKLKSGEAWPEGRNNSEFANFLMDRRGQ